MCSRDMCMQLLLEEDVHLQAGALEANAIRPQRAVKHVGIFPQQAQAVEAVFEHLQDPQCCIHCLYLPEQGTNGR